MLVVALLLCSSLTVMAGATVAPALPAMSEAFASVRFADVLVRLVLTLPALTTAIASPLVGWWIDRRGRRATLLLFMAVYAVAGTTGLYADRLALVLAGRALLGVAVAGIMTTATALISDFFEGHERNRVVGLQASFMGLGGVVFLSLGGWLADQHWRAPFAIYGLALLFLPLVWRSIPEPILEKEEGDGAPPLGPEETRTMVVLCALAFLSTVIFYSIPVQLPYYLESFEGVTRSVVGLALAGMTLCGATASWNYRRLRRHLGTLNIYVVAFGGLGAGLALIGGAQEVQRVYLGLAVLGLTYGLFMPNTIVRATRDLRSKHRGRVVGAIMTSIFLGQFCSPLVTQPLLRQIGADTLYEGLSLPAFALALLVLARRLQRGPRVQPPRA